MCRACVFHCFSRCLTCHFSIWPNKQRKRSPLQRSKLLVLLAVEKFGRQIVYAFFSRLVGGAAFLRSLFWVVLFIKLGRNFKSNYNSNKQEIKNIRDRNPQGDGSGNHTNRGRKGHNRRRTRRGGRQSKVWPPLLLLGGAAIHLLHSWNSCHLFSLFMNLLYVSLQF